MSGIQHGTRLEQLEALARTCTHQLGAARRRDDLALTMKLEHLDARLTAEIREQRRLDARRPEVAAGVRATDTTVEQHLTALGVTARDVKVWAVEQGLIPALVRGRVSALLVNAYEQSRSTTP